MAELMGLPGNPHALELARRLRLLNERASASDVRGKQTARLKADLLDGLSDMRGMARAA